MTDSPMATPILYDALIKSGENPLLDNLRNPANLGVQLEAEAELKRLQTLDALYQAERQRCEEYKAAATLHADACIRLTAQHALAESQLAGAYSCIRDAEIGIREDSFNWYSAWLEKHASAIMDAAIDASKGGK